MAKDPTKAKKFQDTLRNLLGAKPKQHKDMKVGKKRKPAEAGLRRSNQKKDK